MERYFKGVWIPAELWLNEELTINEKLFLVEINNLDNSEGCYANNSHFSKFFNLTKQRCSEIINALKNKGYVTIETNKDGNRIQSRIIKINCYKFNGLRECTPSENLKGVFGKVEGGYSENLKGVFGKVEGNNINNINNNIINNNTSEDVYVPPESGTSTSNSNYNFKTILEEWNKLSEPIPKLKKINSNTKRYTMLKARVAEYGEDEVLKAIKNINDSDFLQGKATDFVINFDWFIKPNNFLKVYENNYANKTKKDCKDIGDDPYAEFYQSIL